LTTLDVIVEGDRFENESWKLLIQPDANAASLTYRLRLTDKVSKTLYTIKVIVRKGPKESEGEVSLMYLSFLT
jgi:hypothetical protein